MNDPRLYEWIALRRVHDGGVAKVAGIYVDHGRPIPSHLAEVFDRLTWDGLLVIAEGDPIWELRRLSLTDIGQGRYAALCAERQQRAPLEAPATECGTRADPGAVLGKSPDVVTGMQLLDIAKRHGFRFRRAAPTQTDHCGERARPSTGIL